MAWRKLNMVSSDPFQALAKPLLSRLPPSQLSSMKRTPVVCVVTCCPRVALCVGGDHQQRQPRSDAAAGSFGARSVARTRAGLLPTRAVPVSMSSEVCD